MSFEFRASAAGDVEEIADLMRTAFSAEPNAPFLDRALLHWKYFEPGPDWIGPRSYVLRQNGSLVAHGCAWPVKLISGGRACSALTLVDWAAAKTSLSAGFLLVRKMASLAEILISIGGSEATRKIMPRIGFQTVDTQSLYARVLRPWRQFRTRPGAVSPRAIARLARTAGYSLARRTSRYGWSLPRVATLDPRCIPDAPPDPTSDPASLHGLAFLDYMTRCPGARVTIHQFLKDGQASEDMGYAVLSLVNGQVRIAELRIQSPDQADWTAAVAAAVDAALEFPEASELVTWTSQPRMIQALQANGFRPRDTRSIFVQDSKNLIAPASHWDLTMLDEDLAFFNSPEHPYAT